MTFDAFFCFLFCFVLLIFWVCWLSPTWYNIHCSQSLSGFDLCQLLLSTGLLNRGTSATKKPPAQSFSLFLAVLSLHCSIQASLVGNCQFSCPEACNILLPWPEIKLVASALKGRLLGPPGKFPDGFSFESSLLSVQTWGTHTQEERKENPKLKMWSITKKHFLLNQLVPAQIIYRKLTPSLKWMRHSNEWGTQTDEALLYCSTHTCSQAVTPALPSTRSQEISSTPEKRRLFIGRIMSRMTISEEDD